MSDKLTSEQLRDLRNMLTTALADGGGLDELVEVLDTKIAYREADETQPVFGSVELTSPPWPPKWGEGPTRGWCRRKEGGNGAMKWDWANRSSIHVGTEYIVDGLVKRASCWIPPDQFAAEFEPA